MRTVFITIFEGVESKNLLRTGVVKQLLDKNQDLKAVLFVKNEERAQYYANELSDPRIFYEVVEPYEQKGIHKIFSVLKFKLLQSETTDLRAKMITESTNKLHYYFLLLVHRIFARPIFIWIFRKMDSLLSNNPVFDGYFAKYQPDVVLLANLFEDVEIDLLKAAKRHGVRTTGLINSWDRVTARCLIRALPDKLIVWNQTLKDQLIKHDDVREEDVYISGIPQYDKYFISPSVSREDFMKSLNLEPSTKLIVYSPIGGMFSNSDWDIMDRLHELHRAGEFGQNTAILVRFSPNDFVKKEDLEKRPHLLYQQPGVRFSSTRSTDWDMTDKELEELRNTLYYMSLIICYASSISIDAAVLDKPVINIGFEVKDNKKLSKSPTMFYNMAHYKKALSYGGITLVKNESELVEWSRKYLDNPLLNRDGRGKLALNQCAYLDGKSIERVTAYLSSLL